MNYDNPGKTISERILLDLQALKDRGLQLTFDDVLFGLYKAKRPFVKDIEVDLIVEKIEDAYRIRTRAILAQPAE